MRQLFKSINVRVVRSDSPQERPFMERERNKNIEETIQNVIKGRQTIDTYIEYLPQKRI